MNMHDVTLSLVTFFVCLGVGIFLCSEFMFRLKRTRMLRRLTSVAVHIGERPRKVDAAAVAASLSAYGDLLIDILVGEGIWPRTISALRVLGNMLAGALVLALVAIFALTLPWWMGVVTGIAALVGIPFILVRSDQAKQCARFEANLADTIDMMVRMLRAGLPVTVAVGRIGSEAQEPTAAIYREANEWLEMGLPLSQAMRKVAQRIKVKDFDFFAAALSIQSTVGGNLTETLQSLSEIIRERSVSMLKARAMTSQARMTANVILGILPGIALMLLLMRPEYILPIIDGSHGYGLLAFILLSYVLALFTIRQLVSRVKIVA